MDGNGEGRRAAGFGAYEAKKMKQRKGTGHNAQGNSHGNGGLDFDPVRIAAQRTGRRLTA